jgi:hypothetical protein
MLRPEFLAMLQLGDARCFLDASRELSFDNWNNPKYYLQIHAIELAGKAFLLANGEGPEEVKKIGHDLVRLFAECRNHGLVLAHPSADWIISLIAPVHADHRLRYMKSGQTELPHFAELDKFCDELIGHGRRVLREKESRREADGEDSPA